MADVKEVAIRLKAISADYKRGMSEAGDSTSQFAKVSGVALAASAVALAGLAKKAADETVDYGRSIIQLSRISGESTETMSKLAFAGQQTGVSTAALSQGIKFLEKNMAAGKKEFGELGVNVRDSSGQLRKSHDVLLDTADAVKKMGTGAQATATSLALFGRSGQTMLPLLLQGRAGILALEAAAEKFGVVLRGDNVDAIKANIKAHREFDAAMLGAKLRVGEQVLPVMTALTEVYAKLPGPISSAIVPVGGFVVALAGVAQVVTMLKPMAKEVGGTLKGIGESMSGASAAVSVGAAIGIAVVLKGLHDIQEESKKTQEKFSGAIDWTNYAKSAEALNRERGEVNRLGAEWNNMNAAERAANVGRFKIYDDLAAQQEEDSKHFAENTARIKAMGLAIGVTAGRAQELADSMHVDLTHLDPAVTTPIFRALASGQITAAEAATRLGNAQRAAAGSAEEYAEANKAVRDATKEANDAEKAAFDPLFAFTDATRKLGDAHEKARTAMRDVQRAEEDLAGAHERVGDAERRRVQAVQKVTEAVQAQREAQRALQDLLRGPSEDESLDVESAQIQLEESRRRAAGQTTTDPGLERRRNQLDVRRSELALKTAEGAHDRNVTAARKNLSAADQALADAQQSGRDAVKGVDDANKAIGDFETKVSEAQQRAADASTVIAKANIDLDIAARNLEASFTTGDVAMLTNTKTLEIWVQQGRLTKEMAEELTRKFGEMKAASDAVNPDKAGGADNQPLAPGVQGPNNPSNQPLAPSVQGPNKPGTRASGGPLEEGWTLVGEEGPELVHKVGSQARVTAAPATRSMLVAHPTVSPPPGAAGGGGSGGYHHHGDIVIGTATTRTAWDIAWEQRKLALSLGVAG